MGETIERVAAAIAEVLTRDRPHPVSGRGYCLLIVEDADAKEMARAAIEAMRELPGSPGPRYTAGEYSRRTQEAMVDDALFAAKDVSP